MFLRITFRKITIFLIFLTLVIIYVRTDRNVQQIAMKKIVVHLDLKGAAPKIDYLLELLPYFVKSGANGILIEYEDMFPYWGKLKNISALNAYQKEDILKFIKTAEALDLEVIPLVQTFGHLEFVLKLEEFRTLRELDYFPQEICPAKQEALNVVEEMIRQVMEVHRGIKFIHIGCDEVYHIAACDVCSKKSARSIFIGHVRKIANFIKTLDRGVVPIFWDDMMRSWSPADIMEANIGHLAQPVVWVYIEDITRLVPNHLWYAYFNAFPKIWAASAYKGAFGEKEVVPNILRHFQNNLAWINHMEKPKNYQGIIITGWSRYDHFAVLCELLPVSIPSLILNLFLQNTKEEHQAIVEMSRVLNCPEIRDVLELKQGFFRCNFPGIDLYISMGKLLGLQERFYSVLERKRNSGWVSEYNIINNFSSPWKIGTMFPDEGFAAERLKKDLSHFKEDIQIILGKYFDKYTVEEWVEEKIQPMETELLSIEKDFSKLIEIGSWSRRPILKFHNY